MDVERHFPFRVSYIGVLVRTVVMEELGTGIGCALGCSALLGSDGVEGRQDADVNCTCVQEDSYNLLYLSYFDSIQGSRSFNWIC